MRQLTIITRVAKQLEDSNLVNTKKNNSWSAQLCDPTYTGCGRKTWRFLSPVILAIMWGGIMQPRSVANWFHAISVAMEQWTTQHHAFVIEAYFKNGDSAVTTQRLFRRHFNIPRHGRVPCRKSSISVLSTAKD